MAYHSKCLENSSRCESAMSMSMLKLPLELLLQVIGIMLPDDRDALAVRCTKVHQLCFRRLARHETLKTHFRSLTIFDEPSKSYLITPLEKRWRGPWTARYIKHIQLIGRFNTWYTPLDPSELDEETRSIIQQSKRTTEPVVGLLSPLLPKRSYKRH